MLFTTDALIGATLGVTLMATTTPLLLNSASRAIEANRDLVAAQVAQVCNANVILEKDEDLGDLPTRSKARFSGTCGVSGGDVVVTFNEKVKRTVSQNTDGWYEADINQSKPDNGKPDKNN